MILQGLDPLVLALFLGALSLMPLLLVICTSFLKIVIVLMITRNAIGVQQVPPSMAINGIALAATLFIMAPVGYEIAESVKASPLDMSNVQTVLQTGGEAIKPLRAFMLRNVDPDVLTHLLENTARLWPAQMAQEQYFSENNEYSSKIDLLPGFADGNSNNVYVKGEYNLRVVSASTSPAFVIAATRVVDGSTDRWTISNTNIDPVLDTPFPA